MKKFSVKRAREIKLKKETVLLILLLLFVTIPYLLKGYQAISDWKQKNDRITQYAKLIKSENETREKQEKLLQTYGITHLELYDNAITYLQAKTSTQELKNKYGSCENPISPTPTLKPKSYYFDDIDHSKFSPSGSKTEYEQFISDCAYIKEHENTFNLFNSGLSRINLLISENIKSTDKDIQQLIQSLIEKVKDYQQATSNGYIMASPVSIPAGGNTTFEYGYKDSMNNEHLKTAITTITVQTPSKKKFQANFAKIFPFDFPGANTNEVGRYVISVERYIKTTYGTNDILFHAENTFTVEK